MTRYHLLYLLSILLFSLTSCVDKIPKNPIPNKDQEAYMVSQFVYDGMYTYYLWDKQMVDKKPTTADTDPEKYFYSLLHSTDVEHNWSWITDDIESLMKGFAGEAVNEYGFVPAALWANQERTQLVGFVRYVYPNTPAADAGFKRGQIIGYINGQKITLDNYMLMYGSSKAETFTVYDQEFKNPVDISVTPTSFDANTVLHYDVLTDEDTNNKIGYLFYTGFKSKFNSKLAEAFNYFKTEGVTDLVVDLRYNPGGDVTAATYLASLIAPKAVVENKEVLTIMSYNDFVNSAVKKEDRSYRLGAYKEGEINPLDVNMDLNKVYIIAQSSSASASELLTFCLRPHMDVVHIGEKTAGKYTASWTIHAYNNFAVNGSPRVMTIYDNKKLPDEYKVALKDWGMQPIVGRYTDKNGADFMIDDGLLPNHPVASQENNTETWKPIGDPDDYLLAKAISLITGKPYAATRAASPIGMIDNGLMKEVDKVISESVQVSPPMGLAEQEQVLIYPH